MKCGLDFILIIALARTCLMITFFDKFASASLPVRIKPVMNEAISTETALLTSHNSEPKIMSMGTKSKTEITTTVAVA